LEGKTIAGMAFFLYDGRATFDTAGKGSSPEGLGYSYLWDFGDGTTSTLANPTHTYTQPGAWTVRVTATDSLGAIATQTMTVIVDTPYDDWRFTHFTSGELLDPAISSHHADPDGDGLVNLLEYAFGLEPKLANTAAGSKCSQQEGYLCLTYRQSKSATDVTYTVEACSDLKLRDWSSAGPVELSREDKGEYWEVTVRDVVPISNAPQRFLRLKVSLP
jgi:PKD repeat protein